MSLADEARALGPGPGGLCGIARLLATLGPSEQAEVNEALDSPVSATKLSKAIRGRDWPYVSDQSIQRHRQRVCRCE